LRSANGFNRPQAAPNATGGEPGAKRHSPGAVPCAYSGSTSGIFAPSFARSAMTAAAAALPSATPRALAAPSAIAASALA
jgi:hypothetical protein